MVIMNLCMYYRAKVDKPLTWFFVATLRSSDHLCFDRTYDAQEGIFEFFVPEYLESDFLNLMKYYEDKGLISDFKKLPNRLQVEEF